MKLIGNYYSMLTLWIPVKDKGYFGNTYVVFGKECKENYNPKETFLLDWNFSEQL